MFSKEFEIVLMIVLAVITVMFLMGKGDLFLKTKGTQAKRTPEEQKKLGRVSGCFTGLLLVGEGAMFFFGDQRWITIVYLVIAVGGLLGFAAYGRNH
jgi:hypothetical protein